MPSFDRNIAVPLFVLSVTQIIGWGTVGLPAIAGRQMADDLKMGISSVFAGGSVLFVVMGLWAPFLARAFTRFVGGRHFVFRNGVGFAIAAHTPKTGAG